jgi:hypothetical protein
MRDAGYISNGVNGGGTDVPPICIAHQWRGTGWDRGN